MKSYCDMCGGEHVTLAGVINTFFNNCGHREKWTFTICPLCAEELQDFIEQHVKLGEEK